MKKTSLTYASSALCLALSLGLWASPAFAQERDIAGAEALFQEGRRLMEDGDSEAACPKLKESQRLDPGTGTLWHLARCYQDTGRLASAWATFHLVAQEAQRLGEDAKVKAALDRAKKLAPKLHKLTIEVPEDSRIDGLKIQRAGAEVGKGAWGAAVPVDTGELVIEASAPGYKRWTETIDVSGDSKEHSIAVPTLKKKKKKVVTSKPPPPAKKKQGERWYQDKLGWAVFATGLATTAGGGVTFLSAGSLEDEANASGDLADRDRLFDDAHTREVTGGVLLATGAGITLVGVVLLALTPTNSDTEEVSSHFTPSISLGSSSAFLGLSKEF